jgi:hypothetical protein
MALLNEVRAHTGLPTTAPVDEASDWSTPTGDVRPVGVAGPQHLEVFIFMEVDRRGIGDEQKAVANVGLLGRFLVVQVLEGGRFLAD